MQVTVNKPNLAEGTSVEVQYPFARADGKGELYVRLGVFANGTSTTIDGEKVNDRGGVPVDIVVGEPLPVAPPVTVPKASPAASTLDAPVVSTQIEGA